MTTLYHYTCSHAAPHIRRDGVIRPAGQLGRDAHKWAALTAQEQQVALGVGQFAWFTDLAPPAPASPLGLTRLTLRCDRTAYCFTVEDRGIVPWMTVRRSQPALRNLDWADGAMPRHWFVSRSAIPVCSELNAHTGGLA
jgi:hypothetical protein